MIIFVGLALILFPTLDHQRGSRAVSCISNLKQQALATQMYSEDYDNRLPEAKTWMDILHPYVGKDRVFQCPDMQENRRKSEAVIFDYAYHSRLSKVNVSSVLNPAIVPLTYDSTLEARNSSDPFISLPNPGRHFGGDNMSLVDGHVKWKDMAGIQELQGQMKAWTFIKL
jgi:hypothetical protein